MLNISNKFFGENKSEESMDIANDYSENKEKLRDANVDLGAKMEIVDNKKANEKHASVLIDKVDDEECRQKKEAMNEANNVSIDVTKALLLLGINSWSNLEPANKKGVIEHVEEVLNKAMAIKLRERREYLDIIEETKDINYDLYLKMIQANGKRSIALAQKARDDNAAKVIVVPENLKEKAKPLRRVKSTKPRRVTKKCKAVIEEPDEEAEQDEEEIALAWAYTVLMKEFYRRNEVRGKNATTKKKVNDKLDALWRFRKLKEKKKLEERKKNKERKMNEMMKTAAASKAISGTQKGDKVDKKVDKNADESNDLNGLKKKGSFKRKVQVVNLAEQIKSKRKPAEDGSNPLDQEQLYRPKTDEEKVEEAKKVLRYLKERQRLRDQLDSLGNKRKTKMEETELEAKANEEKNDIQDTNLTNAEKDTEQMNHETNASSNASSAAQSRKGSKKRFFSRIKTKVKRTASDPVEAKNRNLLAVKPLNQNVLSARPNSSLLPKRQVSRTTSAPYGSKSKALTPSPQQGNRKANVRDLSRKSSTSSTISRMTDEDSNDSSQFASFVKKSLHDSGIMCSKEDEEVVEDAIEKTLHEVSDGSHNSSIHSSMMQIIDGSTDMEELEQRNPERFQKLRQLASNNYDDISLDDINMAGEEVLDNLKIDDCNQLKPNERELNDESNISGHSFLSVREEETRDSTDTFYSLQEESEKEVFSDLDEVSEEEKDSNISSKSETRSNDSLSVEKAFKKL